MKKIIILLIGDSFINMLIDARAFIIDPDARVISQHTLPSGKYMSIREAKQKGLQNK